LAKDLTKLIPAKPHPIMTILGKSVLGIFIKKSIKYVLQRYTLRLVNTIFE
jgi:hypothetical protein